MCLFWRSPTAWSPESTSGDLLFNLAIAYSGKLEIGTRQLNNWRLQVPPDFLPICQPGALSTRLHCSRMPRHHTRPPGRYKNRINTINIWNGLMEEKMKEELMEVELGWDTPLDGMESPRWVHESRHLRAHFSQDKINLGGDSLTHKSHKNCAEFLYSNFKLWIHEVGLPIYRFRSLGREENKVEWEGTKYGAARCWHWSMPHHFTCSRR